MEPHAGGMPGLRPVPGTGTAVAHGAREVRAGKRFDARERCPGTVPGTGFSHFATLHGSAQRVPRRTLAAGGTPSVIWGVAPTSGHVPLSHALFSAPRRSH